MITTNYRQVLNSKGIFELWHDKTWDDYEGDFYKKEVLELVEREADENVLLYGNNGTGKCFGKGTQILMFDGSIKRVEDIKEGELLMGDDSTPRKVQSLARGQEEMFLVQQLYGEDYVVNKSHILSLKPCPSVGSEIVNITVEDYLTKNKTWKKTHLGYKKGVEYPEKELPLDPYFLGIWLGDGTAKEQAITTNNLDIEVIEYYKVIAEKFGCDVSVTVEVGGCKLYRITNQKGKPNPIKEILRSENLLDNKHIPIKYLINSTENRLQLLAGLLDSDGSYDGCFEITQKSFNLSTQIVNLCRSLGFRATLKPKMVNKSFYYRVHISGHLDRIPTKVFRKKARKRTINKEPLSYGIQVTSIGVGDYYGFTLDGNRLFLLEDFTVVHNTMLLNLAFKDLMLKGNNVHILDFRQLVHEYLPGFGSSERFKELMNCDYLGIDDLGKEFSNSGVSKELITTVLDYILRHRYHRQIPTWITSNMALGDFKTEYGEHIASLLKRSSIAIAITGEDYGAKKFKKITK